MKFTGILILILLVNLLGCNEDDCCNASGDITCATFDMRQCNGNPWIGAGNAFPDSEKEHADLLQNYLEDQAIDASVEVDNDFHTFVCEACFVCPLGPRYEVRIQSQDTLKLRNLVLLNLEFHSCIQ